MELLWDANRDPTQRLAISGEINAPRSKAYDGSFLVGYPDRSFSGFFDIVTGAPHYNGTARFSWSAYENVALDFNVGVDFEGSKNVWASTTLTTPFEGWHSNGINIGMYLLKNNFLANASLEWADKQHLRLAVGSDYLNSEPELRAEFKIELNSTVSDVPTACAQFKHVHTDQQLNTKLIMELIEHGQVPTLISVVSAWKYDHVNGSRNLNGSIVLRSPVDGYRNGDLSTMFSLSEKKQIVGAANLRLEDKKFTLQMDGFVKKMLENMLEINATTPIDKYRTIYGRFGINQKNKHVVAAVRAPTGALGVEFLWDVTTISDFDVKFNIETPMKDLEKCMLIGKMKPDSIDMRGALNKNTIGFVGVWRKITIYDFEYSYKVFTPLPGYEENGFVVRNSIKSKQDFDLELSVKYHAYKLGVLLSANPKSIMLRKLARLKKNTPDDVDIDEDAVFFKETISEDEGEENNGDDKDNDREYVFDEETLSFLAKLELDTMMCSTIVGVIDVEEDDENIYAHGTLSIPNGRIKIWNRLLMAVNIADCFIILVCLITLDYTIFLRFFCIFSGR